MILFFFTFEVVSSAILSISKI